MEIHGDCTRCGAPAETTLENVAMLTGQTSLISRVICVLLGFRLEPALAAFSLCFTPVMSQVRLQGRSAPCVFRFDIAGKSFSRCSTEADHEGT